MEVASVERMAFPLPDKPSIAVLPFVNMSGDPEQDYFSDGITEQIITGLSNVPKLFVIARNSSFTYKGKPVKVQKIAEELGAGMANVAIGVGGAFIGYVQGRVIAKIIDEIKKI